MVLILLEGREPCRPAEDGSAEPGLVWQQPEQSG